MDIVIILVALVFLVGYYLFTTMQDLRVKRAERAVQSGDLETALSIFMNSLKKNPDDIDALWHIGNINEEKNHYPEAIGYYTKLIEIGKESKLFTLFELYKRVGLLYLKIERDAEALDFLMQAYQMIQSSREVLENIAMIVYSQQYFHRALAFFEKASQFEKDNPSFSKHYGLCQVLSDKVSESAVWLEEALKMEPQDHQTKYILAYVYYRTGAVHKAREYIEDILNSDKITLSNEEFYYALKMLFSIYLDEKNFDITRELIQQMKDVNSKINDPNYADEISMSYIFFRVRQGYYDVAMDEIGKNVTVKTGDERSAENLRQARENRSHLFELVSALDKYKKEKEKAVYTGSKSVKYDLEYSMVETRALDAQKELDDIIQKWQDNYVKPEPLWKFFGVKTKTKFDPTLVIDKYAESSISTLKQKARAHEPMDRQDEETLRVATSEEPCERMLSMDFPSFLNLSRKLAENMGFSIINQAVKTDPMAYAEGQSADMLCQEKLKRDSRVLFCVRRWREPIGYLSIMTIMGAINTVRADRLVLVSYSPLSSEASRAIEGNSRISFYRCDDIVSYLS